jgi:hypothetical protein
LRNLERRRDALHLQGLRRRLPSDNRDGRRFCRYLFARK